MSKPVINLYKTSNSNSSYFWTDGNELYEQSTYQEFLDWYNALIDADPCRIMPAVHLYTPESGDDYEVIFKSVRGDGTRSFPLCYLSQYYADRDCGLILTSDETEELNRILKNYFA